MITKPPLRTLQPNHVPPPGETHQSRRQRQRLFQAACLSLGLRKDRENLETMERDYLLYKEVVLELRKTPPMGLTLDIFQLWRKGSAFLPRTFGPHESSLQMLYLKIQNEVFHRLLRTPLFLKMQQALKDLKLFQKEEPAETNDFLKRQASPKPLTLEESAIVYLTAQLFRPLMDLLLDSFRPHPVRELDSNRKQTVSEGTQKGTVSLEEAEWAVDPVLAIERFEAEVGLQDWVISYHELLIEHWLRIPSQEWLNQGQASILQYMEQLSSPLQRVRWHQLHQAASLLSPASNLHSLVVLRDLGYREWNVPTSSTKPEGGYSGLARRGDVASLLPSELLFWNESQGVNPFFARWMENECLFYEREQSHSYTRHRTLQFVLDLDPGEIRFKTKEAPAQGLAVLMSLLTRVSLDLRQVCPEEVLSFQYRLGPSRVWDDEASLFSLFLSHQPGIGASTDFLTWDEPLQQMGESSPSPQQMRLYIATPARWKTFANQSEQPKTHMSLYVTPEVHPAPVDATLTLPLFELDEGLSTLPTLRDRMLELILQTPL